MKFSGFIFAAEDEFSQQARYRFILEAARYLDANGYTAIWTPERHFQEFGGSFPNPAVLSAALATITSRLQLRAGSVVTPHHHPVRIAEEWALVDQLSQGRAGVCFATGWHKRDFVFYPEHYEDRKAFTFDSIDRIRALWAGQSCQFQAGTEPLQVRTYPSPVQPEIPVWLVFSSDPDIWVRAGSKGFNVLSLLNDWSQLEAGIKLYRKARSAAGLAPALGCVTVAVHTFVGEDDDAVRQLVEQPLKKYLRSFLRARTDSKRLATQERPISDEERDLILEASFEDLFRNRSLVGGLEKCRRNVARMRALGVDEIAALIDFGVDFEHVLAALSKLTELKESSGDAPAATAPAVSASGGFDWYFKRQSR